MTPAEKARGPRRRLELEQAVSYAAGMLDLGFSYGEAVDEACRRIDAQDHRAAAARLAVIDSRRTA